MGVFCVGCCYIVDKIHLFINEASVRYKKKKKLQLYLITLPTFKGFLKEYVLFYLSIWVFLCLNGCN